MIVMPRAAALRFTVNDTAPLAVAAFGAADSSKGGFNRKMIPPPIARSVLKSMPHVGEISTRSVKVLVKVVEASSMRPGGLKELSRLQRKGPTWRNASAPTLPTLIDDSRR